TTLFRSSCSRRSAADRPFASFPAPVDQGAFLPGWEANPVPFSLRISIATRLLLWAGLASALFYIAVALGWCGLKVSRDCLRAVQVEQLTVLAAPTEIEHMPAE